MSTKYTLSHKRYKEIIAKFPQKKIMVMGDVGMDRYTIGSASRLSPEAPVPVVAVTSQTDKLGMAANIADNLITFGSEPVLTTLIGHDRIGKELVEHLGQRKISSNLLFEHSSRRTSLKERVIAQNQHVVRIDHESIEPLSEEAETFYLGKILDKIKDADALLLEDYAKGLLTSRVLKEVIERARKEKKFIAVDPPTMGTRQPSDYFGVSMITPNVKEAEKLSGIEIRDESSLKKAGDYLVKAMDCPMVVITRGEKGMSIFSPQNAPYHIPTFARAVFDVSGAGDTVVSMLTLALVSGASIEESAILANFAAGVEVGKQGTATVTLQELEEYMQSLNAFA